MKYLDQGNFANAYVSTVLPSLLRLPTFGTSHNAAVQNNSRWPDKHQVSGMQEDLAMYGNEYTYAQTAYTCAYAVMQVPSTLIIQKIRPSVWLVFMEVGWVSLFSLMISLYCCRETRCFIAAEAKARDKC